MAISSLQGLRAFRAVVELKSFKRAGTRLGLGGSAVSKLVAGLEQELGVLLLQRTTRTLALTEAGADFYDSVVQVLDETESAVERLRERGGKPAGLLRVSVPTSFALRWLGPRLPDFMVRYPGLELNLSLNDRFVDLVAERFDCALRVSTTLEDSSLHARRLGHMPRVLVAAPRYLKAAPPLRTPADLAAHQLLVYATTGTGNRWPFMAQGRQLTVPVTGRLQVDNSLMLREALLAGLGVTLTPHFVVDDLLAARKLVTLLPQCMPPAHAVFGVTTQRRHLPMKVQCFLDFVEAALRDSGYGEAA
ncbi:LysR family transcriptional regulator [Ideonella sp. BN130291]|uniref:LysR family transcriptional regulator n=1 Tax=Ideonella sp. BN130291 TaxID=3112940 RepID=UPI002E25249B|nr:LysR substrate-binding domain-containing protein [Ideonella sp. BN130291]